MRIYAQLNRLGINAGIFSGMGEGRIKVSTRAADDTTIELIAGLSKVYTLTLDEGRFTTACLGTIAKLDGLQELSLRNVPVGGNGLENLAGLAELRWLSLLGQCDLSDESFKPLKQCKVERLVLGDECRISPQGFALLASLPTLKILHISGDSITDEGLKSLAASKSLSELVLTGTAFTDAGLRELAPLPRLRSLRLESGRITTSGMRNLKSAAALENLHLGDCPLLDDDSLAAIGELTPLRQLSLGCSAMTDAGLPHLAALEKLEQLSLKNARFTGAGLGVLAALPDLSVLTVEGVKVSNVVFEEVNKLAELKTLNVGAGEPTGQPGITDDGLTAIGYLPQLQSIRFNGTGLTNRGLIPLRTLPRLSQVQLISTPHVSTPAWSPAGLQL